MTGKKQSGHTGAPHALGSSMTSSWMWAACTSQSLWSQKSENRMENRPEPCLYMASHWAWSSTAPGIWTFQNVSAIDWKCTDLNWAREEGEQLYFRGTFLRMTAGQAGQALLMA